MLIVKLKRFWSKKILLASIVVVLIGMIILTVVIYRQRRDIIPTSIARKISFVVYWPNSSNVVADRTSIKYDSQKGVFSYTLNLLSVSTTVTEQATPSEFTDVSGYYSAFINHLNNYDTFDSSSGTVYLTEPSNTSGTTAIINHSGTLLFAHAQSKISENDWRQFFNNIKVILN